MNLSKVRSAKSASPPRPPNGFLLCRKNVHKQARERAICNMRVISKVTGMLWRSATSNEKETYEELANRVKDLHSKRYPNYKYKPTSRAKSRAILYQPYTIPEQQQIVSPLVNSEQTIPPSYSSVLYNHSEVFEQDGSVVFVPY